MSEKFLSCYQLLLLLWLRFVSILYTIFFWKYPLCISLCIKLCQVLILLTFFISDNMLMKNPLFLSTSVSVLLEVSVFHLVPFYFLLQSTGAFIAASRYASATHIPSSVISRGIGWLVRRDLTIHLLACSFST